MTIRAAVPADIDAMAALSEAKRRQYEPHQPVFHRPSEDALEQQKPFLATQLERANNICLVHEAADGLIDGFVIATVHDAPPVYNPGGKVCGVDDFCVARAEGWQEIGQSLLAAVWELARDSGAVLNIVVCGPKDVAKRDMLAGLGYSVASEWFVKELN